MAASRHLYVPLPVESGTDVEILEEGDALGEGGCCSDNYRNMYASITSSDIYRKLHASITGVAGRRAFMLVTTVTIFIDQYLDGGVAVALENDIFKSLAMLLVLSIVLPQVIAWAFLWQNSMVGYASLLRILLFPITGFSMMMFLELAAVPEARFLKDVALFSTAISLEPIWHLRKGWATGNEVEESFWSTVSEGLMEAPASAGFTLYPAMLKSVYSFKGPSPLFIVSSVWSLVMVTRASTKLHFYGTQPSAMEYAKKLILMKFPQVISQVIGLVAFAFLTRPLPQGIRDHKKFSETAFNDEIGGKSISRFVFVFIALEIVMNFAILRTISPKMRISIAALFATTMVVGSPPGFLRALDGARLGHALQHLMIMVVMATIGVGVATEAHWEVLVQEYPFFGAMFLVSVPWAFIASVLMKNEMPLEERLKLAQEKLAKAISSNDYMMIRLLVDVEGVDILARFDQALESQQPEVCNVLVKSLPEVRYHCKSKFEEALRQVDVCFMKKLVLGAPALATHLDADARQRTRDLFSSKSNPLEAVHQLLDAGVWDITEQKFSKVASMVTLFIHCPDGQHECGGGYLLQMEQMVNGMPLWRRAGSGTERWLYSGTDGKWHIGDQEEKDNNFNCTSSWISSEAEHGGFLPPDIKNWKLSDSDKVVRFSSPGLKITTEFPAHPAALFVHNSTDDYVLCSQDPKEFIITRDHGGLAGFATEGRRVTDIEANGPAYRAGLRYGYSITHVDSVEVTEGNVNKALEATKVPDRSFTIRVKNLRPTVGDVVMVGSRSGEIIMDDFTSDPFKVKFMDTGERSGWLAEHEVRNAEPLQKWYVGEYRLQMEDMANGMPLWRRVGMGVELWLYSSINGTWTFCDKNAKEQNFKCALGFLKSGDAHGGLFPPDMQSWKWSDKKEVVSVSGLKVTTEVPAYPPFLSVDSPASQSECMAGYWLEKEQMANGMPLWRKAGMGAERWLYSGTNGRWFIGGSAEKEGGFNCSVGFIQSKAEHGGLLPPSMHSWRFCDSDKEERIEGIWCYGEAGKKCYSLRGEPEGTLRFHEQFSEGTTSGLLRPLGDWYEGRLFRGQSEWGTIRLRLDCAQVVSNFKDTGDIDWGRDIVAQKTGEAVEFADPAVIFIKCPVGQQPCGGEYQLQTEQMANDMPLWRRAGMGVELWLYSGTSGKWFIGGSRAKEKGFNCSVGFIHSEAEHGGTLPPSMQSWRWWDSDKKEWFPSPGLEMTTKVPAHPAAIFVRIPDGQKASAGEYQLQMEQMANGMPIWRRAGMGEERWLYSGTYGTWDIVCQDAQEKSFNSAICYIKSGDTHGGLSPPDMQSWKRYDGAELVPSPDLKVSTKVPKYPAALFVHTPDGQKASAGEYRLQKDKMANGMPLWRRAGMGEERWLYSGTDGIWDIFCQYANEKDFCCAIGYIKSGDTHGGLLPHDMQSWKWYDGAELVPSPGLKVTTEVPAYPTILSVQSPDGQPECAGVYLLEKEQMANGMPLWIKAGAGAERWLYSGTCGRWFIGGRGEKEKGFNCWVDLIHSEAEHGGILPPSMQRWKWWDSDKKEWLHSPGLNVSTDLKITRGLSHG